jgi:glycine/D-amino acid oxidase-like deaminating enzyme
MRRRTCFTVASTKRAFAPTIPLLLASIRLWRELEVELAADLEFSLRGGILIGESEADLAAIARKASLERAQGLEVELLNAAEVRRLAPYLGPRVIGGAFCPTEGKANPLKVTPAFATAAARYGARILCHCRVTGLAAAGNSFRVTTSSGAIRARRVVDAAGAEAGRIAALLGLDLPIEGHPIQVAVTEAAAPLVPHLVYCAGEKLTLKQARNGSFLIGGGWPARWSQVGDRPVVDLESLSANLTVAQRIVPALGAVRLLRVWPAIVNGTADWRPILGEVSGLPGFFITMFPWVGFTAGPIAAALTADLVLGRTPRLDIADFTVQRPAAHPHPDPPPSRGRE